MTQTPIDNGIPHNVRVIHTVNGDHVICNFTQVREDVDGENKFVAYQCLYPLTLSLTSQEGEDGQENFQVGYRRWNPYSPYEDVRINPSTVISAMPPAQDILQNYVSKLNDAGVDPEAIHGVGATNDGYEAFSLPNTRSVGLNLKLGF